MLNDGRTSIPMHSFLSVNVQMTSERGSDSWLYIHLPGASLRSFGITEFREGQGARFFASVRQPRQAMYWSRLLYSAAWCLLLQRNVIFRDLWWVLRTFISPTGDPSRFSTRLHSAPHSIVLSLFIFNSLVTTKHGTVLRVRRVVLKL